MMMMMMMMSKQDESVCDADLDGDNAATPQDGRNANQPMAASYNTAVLSMLAPLQN